MGQRSEIYVAYETNAGKEIVGRYFGWNYGERMISRVAYTALYLKNHIQYGIKKESLVPVIEMNFDMVDHQITESLVYDGRGKQKISVSDDGLNDGRAFIYITLDGSISYCFTNNHELKPLDCDEYMLFDTESCYDEYKWSNEEYRKSNKMKKCRSNIRWLKKNAKLMSQKELEEFINAKYIA